MRLEYSKAISIRSAPTRNLDRIVLRMSQTIQKSEKTAQTRENAKYLPRLTELPQLYLRIEMNRLTLRP